MMPLIKICTMHFAIVFYLLFVYISYSIASGIIIMCLNNCVKQSIFCTTELDDHDGLDSDVILNCNYLEHDDLWTSENNELFVVQWNIRGLYSKLDQIKHVIDNNPGKWTPDLILLCETWLNSNTSNIRIPGYSLVRNDRKGKAELQ